MDESAPMSTAGSPSVLSGSLPDATRWVGHAVRGVAFWAGIALAFAQVPLLLAGVTAHRPLLLTALLAANVVAMALGSGHRA